MRKSTPTMAFCLVAIVCSTARADENAPEVAQVDPCSAALSQFEAVGAGHTHPAGWSRGSRLFLQEVRTSERYGWDSDRVFLLFDAVREYTAIQENCPLDRWPASATAAGIAELFAAHASNARALCGADDWKRITGAEFITHRMQAAAGTAHEEQRLELARQELHPSSGHFPGAVRVLDARWFTLVATELVRFCAAHPALHQAPAKTAWEAAQAGLARAERRVAWLRCDRQKDAVRPHIAAVDAASRNPDLAALKAAVVALEVAMRPVVQACAASPDGLADLQYTLDAKHIVVIMREVPGCQAALAPMSVARKAIDQAADKATALAGIAALRAAGASASTACGGRVEVSRWAEYVAGVAERNAERLPR